MLKVCTSFKRRSGLSVAEYQGYWADEHPTYVRKLPGLRAYQQNRPLPATFGNGSGPAYDGLVELWFDDSAALKEMSRSSAYADLVRDEERFVDRPSIDIVFTDEKVVKDGPREAATIKRVTYFRRAQDLDPETFQSTMLAVYGARVAADQKVRRYVVSLARLGGYRDSNEPVWDAIDMAWFADLETAQADPHAALLAGLARSATPPRLFCHEFRIVASA